MNLNEFINLFAEQFETIDTSGFSSETKFHDLDEWCSLLALSVKVMIDEEFDVQIKLEEMRRLDTIGQLYETVRLKQGQN